MTPDVPLSTVNVVVCLEGFSWVGLNEPARSSGGDVSFDGFAVSPEPESIVKIIELPAWTPLTFSVT